MMPMVAMAAKPITAGAVACWSSMAATANPSTVGAGAWGELLRAPGVGRVVAAGLVARLPLGMEALGDVLVVRGRGQACAGAGVVVAASALATAAGPRVLGRLIDRVGQARVLLPIAVAFPAAVAGLIL